MYIPILLLVFASAIAGDPISSEARTPQELGEEFMADGCMSPEESITLMLMERPDVTYTEVAGDDFDFIEWSAKDIPSILVVAFSRGDKACVVDIFEVPAGMSLAPNL